MAEDTFVKELGFDPATDVDAVNAYYLEALEAIAEDNSLTLADFSAGRQSPKFNRHFINRFDDRMASYSCFAQLCLSEIVVKSQDMLKLFNLVRSSINESLIESIFNAYREFSENNAGRDAAVLEKCSIEFPTTTVNGIYALKEIHKDERWNAFFVIRHDPNTFALEYAQETDYDYMLDEVAGAYSAWMLIDADEIKELFENKKYKSTQKNRAAREYPSAEILDRCVMAMAKILPRMYCGVNKFFSLHSDPEAAVKAYMDARMERPSTMPAQAKWTRDVAKGKGNIPIQRPAVKRVLLDPRDDQQKRDELFLAAANEAKKEKEAAVAEANEKNPVVALLLCLLLGILGAHKFYQGKTGMGLLYLLTGGLCGIGVLVDLVVLIAAVVKKC